MPHFSWYWQDIGGIITSVVDASALVVGKTTITNSSLTLPIRKIDSNTKAQIGDAEFELRIGSLKLYFDSANTVLTVEQVKSIIGMEVTDDEADEKMAEKGICSSFKIGAIMLRGLALNTAYTLHEMHSPDGYIITANDSTFTLTKDNTGTHVTATGSNTSVDKDGITLLIANEPGAALPNTGGPGIRLFTILGSIMILGAGILLWRRRRVI